MENETIKTEERTPELIIIEPGQNVIELTLDQLRETRTFADAFGIMPKKFPVEHHIFIQKLLDMAEEHNTEPKVGSILANVKNIEKISESEAIAKNLNQDEAQNTAVKVLVGRIDLGNEFAKELWNLSIGFMYHEKGIEVCIGTNISICSNLTIFGDTTHYKNFGRNGLEMSEMFREIENWFGDLDGFDMINTELLERMIAIPINWKIHSDTFIGDCLKHAIRKAYHKGDPFPMNVGQVSKMTSYIIEAEDEYANFTAYHLYNAGTYILTHNNDLQNRFADIKAFTHWFEENWVKPNQVVDLCLKEDPEDEERLGIVNQNPMTLDEAEETTDISDDDLPV